MAITGFKNFIPRNDSNLYIYDTSKREEKNITDFSGDFITIENNEFGSNGANIGQTYCDSFQEIKKMSIDYDDYIKNPSKYSYIKNNNLSLDIKSLFQNSLIFSSSEIKKMKNIKLNFLNFKIEALKKIRDLNSEMEKLIKLSPHTSVIEESNKNELRSLNQEIEKLENNNLDSMSPKMLSNILYQLETNGIILNYDDIIYYDYLSNEIYLKCGLIVKVKTGLFNDIESIKNVNTGFIYKINEGTTNVSMIFDEKNGIAYRNVDGRIKNVNLFDDENQASKQYGGDQMTFREKGKELLEDPYILDQLKTFFPNATMEDYELYLSNICGHGCPYVGLANTVFEEYVGREKEFEETFGYKMYTIDEDGNLDYNYEYMEFDFFNYLFANSGYDIEEIYENGGLGIIDNTKFPVFMQDKYNVNCKFEKPISSFPGCDKYSHEVDYKNAVEVYNNLKNQHDHVYIGSNGYDLYNMDGSLHVSNGGGHAMYITGITDDNRFIVSSWGSEFILDLKNVQNDPDVKNVQNDPLGNLYNFIVFYTMDYE